MKLFQRLFARSDRKRARDYLQQVCDERLAARRALDEKTRLADRALEDAKALEREEFREDFFGKRDPVRSAFIGSGR